MKVCDSIDGSLRLLYTATWKASLTYSRAPQSALTFWIHYIPSVVSLLVLAFILLGSIYYRTCSFTAMEAAANAPLMSVEWLTVSIQESSEGIPFWPLYLWCSLISTVARFFPWVTAGFLQFATNTLVEHLFHYTVVCSLVWFRSTARHVKKRNRVHQIP